MDEHKNLPTLERGRDLSRILAFTDGVFAIAITLLVLQIAVPEGLTDNRSLVNRMDDMLPNLFAFAISFMVIGGHWITHHRLMRMVEEYDSRLIVMTLFYLAWVVLLPFTSQMIGEYGSQIHLSVAFYIGNLALISVGYALMVRTVITHRLGDPRYVWDLELSFKSSVYVVAIFIASIPIGMVLGPWTPLLWFPLLAFDPWQRKRDAYYGQRPDEASDPEGSEPS